MDNKYFKLKIPFATTQYIRDTNKGLIIRGNAFYIFNAKDNEYVDEYIEIIKGNFKTSYKLKENPTKYYKNKLFKNFRDKYLDVYSLNSKLKFQWLNETQIKEINVAFKNMNTTVRNMFSCLSGYNIPGSERNNKASPMKCIDNEYWECNFANVLNHFKVKNKKNKIKINDKDLKVYKLEDVIKKNLIPKFNEIFEKYNPKSIINDDSLYNKDNNKINNIFKNKEFKFQKNQEDFLYSIINKTIDDYEQFMKDQNKLKNRLRSFFTSNINFCLSQKIIPLYSTTKLVENNIKLIENAHLIPFSDCISKLTFENLLNAINPFNCLRIDRNTHKLFDDKQIFFDRYGNKIDLKNKNTIKNFLNVENMHPKTYEFYEKYLKNIKEWFNKKNT